MNFAKLINIQRLAKIKKRGRIYGDMSGLPWGEGSRLS
jgi:hypothetical protein